MRKDLARQSKYLLGSISHHASGSYNLHCKIMPAYYWVHKHKLKQSGIEAELRRTVYVQPGPFMHWHGGTSYVSTGGLARPFITA